MREDRWIINHPQYHETNRKFEPPHGEASQWRTRFLPVRDEEALLTGNLIQTHKVSLECLSQINWQVLKYLTYNENDFTFEDGHLFRLHNLASIFKKRGGLVAQEVRRSPPTAGVPSSRLGPSIWVSWWTKRGLGRFFTGFLPFSPTTNFIHHFSTLISSISFHFISPCDGASGVVGRHPCYSRTYNIGASSHLIPRPDLVLDTSWGYLAIFRLRKPLKTSTRLVGTGIWTRDLPNASLVRYHGATSLGKCVFDVKRLRLFY